MSDTNVLYCINKSPKHEFLRTIPSVERVNLMAWGARMQIAVDVARGLAFLHSLDDNIIFGDFNTSNVLIDSVCPSNSNSYLFQGD